MKRAQTLVVLVLLTSGALLVHGYHPFAEDAEIYLPGVERILQPELFASDARFFDSYTYHSIFAVLIAESVRASHLSLEPTLFIWHLLSIFMLLFGCRKLIEQCFPDEPARWAGVAMIAGLLTLPVAGTALYIMDQYVNPRNLAAFAGVFAITSILKEKKLSAALWVCFALALHPLMGFFVVLVCGLLLVGARVQLKAESTLPVAAFFIPVFFVTTDPPAYMEAARLHSFHYLFAWRWYEWLGIIAPLAILWWMGQNKQRPQIRRICQALVIYGLLCFAGAVLFSLAGNYGTLARFQPLRGLHLLYLLMFLFMGGFLGEFVLKTHIWRWIVLFVPLYLGMFLAQRSLFPASAHIEWPGAEIRNPWAKGFLWARNHSEINAKFALDPNYIRITGEDTNGFRVIAQRSKLSDAGKDSGEVSMFPQLAETWWAEVQAQKNWQNFTTSDFQRLRDQYQVNWVILQNRNDLRLQCPYRNEVIMVCRID